jgi:hypothetical protein
MIEKFCQAAGVLNAAGRYAEAEALHEECPGGTWCDCNHSIGEGTALIHPEPRVSPEATTAPSTTTPAEPTTAEIMSAERDRVYKLAQSEIIAQVEHLTGMSFTKLGWS